MAAFKQPGSAGAAASLTAMGQPDTKRRRLDSEPLLLPSPRQGADTQQAAAHRVAGSLPKGPALAAGGTDLPAAPGLRGTGSWGTVGLGSLGLRGATTGTIPAASGQELPHGGSLPTGKQQQQQPQQLQPQQQRVMCSSAVYSFPASLAQEPHASLPLQQQPYNVCMPVPQQHLSAGQWTPAQHQYHQQVGARALPPSSAVQQQHPQNSSGPVHQGGAPGLHRAAQSPCIRDPAISSLHGMPQRAKQSAAQGGELSPALGGVVGGSACDRTQVPSPAHPSPMERLLGMQQTPTSHASF